MLAMLNLGARALVVIGMASVGAGAGAPGLREVHVDGQCLVRQESEGTGAPVYRSDPFICRLESVHRSDHLETAMQDGVQTARHVTVREQEYVLRNTRTEPVVFIVEQEVPLGWRVDSDPQPVRMDGTTAIFEVQAEPGQVVRLHTGERRTRPVEATETLPGDAPAPDAGEPAELRLEQARMQPAHRGNGQPGRVA